LPQGLQMLIFTQFGIILATQLIMKQVFTLLLLSTISFSISAQDIEFDSIGVKSMEIGIVVIKNDTWVIKVDKGNFAEFYLPVNLPEKYCINNQEVVFEGALGRIPMNVKLAGTPLKLSMIRILYRTKPDPGAGEAISNEKQPVAQTNSDSIGYLQNCAGSIILISDVYLITQTLNGETKRYIPDFLPDDFKIANTEITFSAIILKHDPNVRMMGTPIKIKEIRAESTQAFDANLLQDAVKDLFPFDSIGFLPETKGVIKLVAGTYIIEVENGKNDMTRYLPVLLPEAFKREGITVIISGTIGKIPNNVRMVGTPFTLATIGIVE